MTIVKCWLDEAFGVRSVAAVADSQASEKVGAKWRSQSLSTVKLFAV